MAPTPTGDVGSVDAEVVKSISTLFASVIRPRVAAQNVADGPSQRRRVAEMRESGRLERGQIFFGSGRENDFEIGLAVDPVGDPNFIFFFIIIDFVVRESPSQSVCHPKKSCRKDMLSCMLIHCLVRVWLIRI
jgi:hypothetical protein